MNLFVQSYIVLFERDIKALIREISAYESEVNLWKIGGDLNNSGGNLALHLIGNLRHFIGHIIGETDFKRERAAEFSSIDVPRKEILHNLELTLSEVISALEDITDSKLESIYPVNVLGFEMTTAFFIAHLHGHLNYHLGQINYHRRMMV